MQYKKISFICLICFSFEYKAHYFSRKLQSESDIPETEEIPETIPFVVPGHEPESTVPAVNTENSEEEITPGVTTPLPSHNQTRPETSETPETPETPETSETTAVDPHAFPGHENEPPTTIPSIISSPTYDDNAIAPSLILVGIGNFKQEKKMKLVLISTT